MGYPQLRRNRRGPIRVVNREQLSLLPDGHSCKGSFLKPALDAYHWLCRAGNPAV